MTISLTPSEKLKELESHVDALTKKIDAIEKAQKTGGKMKVYNTLTAEKRRLCPSE